MKSNFFKWSSLVAITALMAIFIGCGASSSEKESSSSEPAKTDSGKVTIKLSYADKYEIASLEVDKGTSVTGIDVFKIADDAWAGHVTALKAADATAKGDTIERAVIYSDKPNTDGVGTAVTTLAPKKVDADTTFYVGFGWAVNLTPMLTSGGIAVVVPDNKKLENAFVFKAVPDSIAANTTAKIVSVASLFFTEANLDPYITLNADFATKPLIIPRGTTDFIGSAADVAITSQGALDGRAIPNITVGLLYNYTDGANGQETSFGENTVNVASASGSLVKNFLAVILAKTGNDFLGEFYTSTPGVMTENTHYTVANVPAGLTVRVLIANKSTATISITGIPQDTQDVNNITIVWLPAAFKTPNKKFTDNIALFSKADIEIDYTTADDAELVVGPFYSGGVSKLVEATGANAGSTAATPTATFMVLNGKLKTALTGQTASHASTYPTAVAADEFIALAPASGVGTGATVALTRAGNYSFTVGVTGATTHTDGDATYKFKLLKNAFEGETATTAVGSEVRFMVDFN